jgi:hypothetical protein
MHFRFAGRHLEFDESRSMGQCQTWVRQHGNGREYKKRFWNFVSIPPVSGDNFPEVNIRFPVAILEKVIRLIWVPVHHLVAQPFSGKVIKNHPNISKGNEMASEKPACRSRVKFSSRALPLSLDFRTAQLSRCRSLATPTDSRLYNFQFDCHRLANGVSVNVARCRRRLISAERPRKRKF